MSTPERMIGRYKLLEVVGRGAMGIVWRAEDPFIHRTVAIKILHAHVGLTPEQVEIARERFRREAQAAGRIDHPNVIRILDVGEDEQTGEMYIVMEFVLGDSLERMQNEAGFDLSTSVAIIGQIAAGLDAAHAQGIVHRDIKPSNILLTKDGTAKIVDFGITQLATSALTQDMSELGTPAYMSPEQVLGQPLDARADLFSLGVLSYEILTARRPFEGTDTISTAYAIAHSDPLAISLANPELPRALDPVLNRILAKEPSERFASGSEFHGALSQSLSEAEAAARPSMSASVSSRRHPEIWELAGVATLVIIGLLMFARGEPVSKPSIAVPVPAPSVVVSPPDTPRSKEPPVRAKAKIPIPRPKKPARTPMPAKAAVVAPASPVAAVPPPPEPAKPPPPIQAASRPTPTADVTISLAHRLDGGTLVVSLDGAPIFVEAFAKTRRAFVQTTTWDPLKAPVGSHAITARVNGDNGKTYVSDSYAVDFSDGSPIALSIGFKGGKLTVKRRAA